MSKLQAHLAAAVDHASSTGSGRHRVPQTLGGCLLQDCVTAGDVPQETAKAILQQWEDAVAAARSSAADPEDEQRRLLSALVGLAPEWQAPEGFTSVKTSTQLAAVARLRGLVVLARAAAALHPPGTVLQVGRLLLLFSYHMPVISCVTTPL